MKMNCNHRLLPLAACLLSIPAWAQTPPDAGQTLLELGRPAASTPRQAPSLTLPTEADGLADDRVRFMVREIRLEGGDAIKATDMARLRTELDSLTGQEGSLSNLRGKAVQLTRMLRDAGFALARVVVPAQEIRDGVVRLQVLDGRLGRVAASNQSRLGNERLDALFNAQVQAGEPLRTETLDRALLLASDLPGVGGVAGSLAPGDRVGTADLTIAVTPGKPIEGDLTLDNHGNRYTGQQRLSARLDANNLAGIGDRLRANLTASDEALYYGRLAYDLPIGNDGLRLGAAVARSSYDLGKEFASLQAHGTADTASLYGSYPIIRGRTTNLYLGTTLEHRKLKDNIDTVGAATGKSADVLGLSLEGNWRDGLAGGAFSRWRLAATSGHLSIDTSAARAQDALGPRSAGSYTKWQGSASRLQALDSSTRLYFSLQGQRANRNLDSSEKFALGGAYGVRAYPQGEGVGDEGMLASVELHQDLLPGLDGKVFYDWGNVRINKHNYTNATNTSTLSGPGIGLSWSDNDFFITAGLAWRDRQAADSAPDKSPRGWLQAGWQF